MRSKKKILIVDDDMDLCHIIRTFLDRMGYDTILAVNGKEAVDMATDHLPDLILMDIMLPVMNGLEATQLIRENPETQAVPIIAMTARVTMDDKKKCYLSGCDDFIAKPFTVKELTFHIEGLLKPTPASLAAVSS